MAPRKSVWVLRIVCVVALLVWFGTPDALAKNLSTAGPSGWDSGGQGANLPPGGGGPGGSGGGDNGDPDDISILFNDPNGPTTISNEGRRTELPPIYARIDPFRGSAWYVFFWWTGIGW